MPIQTKLPLPVDERAIRALQERLETIKFANGYSVEFDAVKRLWAPAQVAQVRSSAELHLISGHVGAGSGARGQRELIYRRSSAFEMWIGIPVSLMFFVRIQRVTMNPDVIYRVTRAEILRCILSQPIKDAANEYPIQVGAGPFYFAEQQEIPIMAQPLYFGEAPDYSAGLIELVMLACFSEQTPFLAHQGDSIIFGP